MISAADAPEPSMGAYSQAVELTDAKRIVFVSEFPRTGTGKVQKHAMRAQLSHLYSS